MIAPTDKPRFPIWAIWLLSVFVLVIAGWPQITTRSGWDPDDQLRLVQLRDFLGGQSWFDSTQYRMNVPAGAPMHWSRLIELPLAFFVVPLTPILGQAIAEMVAGTLVPLIGLGLLMIMLSRIARRFAGPQAGTIAALMVLFAPTILQQFLPMRIDHHGWQAVLGVLGLYSLFWDNRKLGGIVLGLALATWLHISLEGLPLTAAFFLFLGWRWGIEKAHGLRLLYTVATFALASMALFLATQATGFQANGFYAANFCDTLSPAHIAAIGIAALIMIAAILQKPAKRRRRLVAGAVAGMAAFATLFGIAPQCSTGAFANLDPLVREYWYIHIMEGLPIWRQDWGTGLTAIIPLFCGLLAFRAIKNVGDTGQQGDIALSAFFLGYATILSCLVFRTATLATAFAIPLLAAYISLLLDRYQHAHLPQKKAVLGAAMLFLAMPGSMVAQIARFYTELNGAPLSKVEAKNIADDEKCMAISSVAKLAELPPANFVSTFDMGPAILLTTPHTVLASSHHRNAQGMHDQIQIFRSAPAIARRYIMAHHITDIAVCPHQVELEGYERTDPTGLWAGLAKNDVPGWLERMPDKGKGIHIWHVR